MGHKKALYMAIGKSSNGRRNTLLVERITLYQRALTHKAAQTGEIEMAIFEARRIFPLRSWMWPPFSA